MKKILALTTAFCSLFILTGCIEREIPVPLQEILKDETTQSTTSASSAYINWNSFTFQSLNESEDLTVSKGQEVEGAWPISTSKYNGEFLVVAVYSTDCELCKMQAPWLNKLATEISASVSNVNFIVIFSDIFADSDNKEVTWIKNLPMLDPYTNVINTCSGNVCKRVFAPRNAEPVTPTIYFVDKRNVLRSLEAIPWDTKQSPQNLFYKTRNELLNFMNLQPISFNPTTGTNQIDTHSDL